jgi:hypothetical protein
MLRKEPSTEAEPPFIATLKAMCTDPIYKQKRDKIIKARTGLMNSIGSTGLASIAGIEERKGIDRKFIGDLRGVRGTELDKIIKQTYIPTEEEIQRIALDFGLEGEESERFIKSGLNYIQGLEKDVEPEIKSQVEKLVERRNDQPEGTKKTKIAFQELLDKFGIRPGERVIRRRDKGKFNPVTPSMLRTAYNITEAACELLKGRRPIKTTDYAVESDFRNIEIICRLLGATPLEQETVMSAYKQNLEELIANSRSSQSATR